MNVDVAVVGGGFVGRALALALGADTGLKAVLFDAKPAEAPSPADERASAIAVAVQHMLDTLDVWPDVETLAHPISEMVVTDSQLDDTVRPVFLTFDGTVEGGEPFAYMVPNAPLAEALDRRLQEKGVPVERGVRVTAMEEEPVHRRLTLSDGRQVRARLVVACDGARSSLRAMARIPTVGWPYDQYGIVTTITHEMPHPGRAEEHFLPSGPFAILPLGPNRASLVWTERKAEGDRLLALPPEDLRDELAKRVPPHYGSIALDGPVQHYPLVLQMARSFVAPRFALCGDAAHAIHPLAGQGMNLGFKDVAALAEVVIDAARIGIDIGSLATLKRYERWRRFDSVQFAAVCDSLNRLFGLDFAPLRAVRQIGLGLVDRVPALKRAFIGEAAGMMGTPPRLLRGEVL